MKLIVSEALRWIIFLLLRGFNWRTPIFMLWKQRWKAHPLHQWQFITNMERWIFNSKSSAAFGYRSFESPQQCSRKKVLNSSSIRRDWQVILRLQIARIRHWRQVFHQEREDFITTTAEILDAWTSWTWYHPAKVHLQKEDAALPFCTLA